MSVYELTLKGFDGSTDKTDHLIKWIRANNREELDHWIEKNALTDYLDPNCDIADLRGLSCVPKGGVDFIVGKNSDTSLMGWKKQVKP